MGEYTDCGLPLVFRQHFQQGSGEFHVQKKFSRTVCEAAGGIWKTVGVGNIGLYIKNRGSIH